MSRGFRLAAVERMRSRRLEDAGRALARARRELAAATAQRDLLHERLLSCMPDATTAPAEAAAVAQRRAQLRDRIAAADAGLAELAAGARAARDGWVSARADLHAVEALHERFRRSVQAEQDRREQRSGDDLAAVRSWPNSTGGRPSSTGGKPSSTGGRASSTGGRAAPPVRPQPGSGGEPA